MMGMPLTLTELFVNMPNSKWCKVLYSCDLIDEYEARLKADKVAMLEELQTEIEEKATDICDNGWWLTYNNLIQEKIEKLKEVEK